ncbi:MAG: amidohydrolase family protein [Pirellulaceae bacterium]|nr:amidohydrolase family protein [Pirellulaceae bacterium]
MAGWGRIMKILSKAAGYGARRIRAVQGYAALTLGCYFSFAGTLLSQEPVSETPGVMTLDRFHPQPRAALRTTQLAHAKFPVVDVHSHFWLRLRHDPQQLHGFIQLMDRQRIAVCASLDGMLGQRLDDHMSYLWTEYRDRFVIFANVDWQGDGKADDPASWDCHRPDFAHRVSMQLENAKQRGVSGVKVFKAFGLEYRNPDGSLIAVDDPRFDPIWHVCGQLGLPVLIHTADPSAFFEPITAQNERYEELSRHPEWHFPADRFPSRVALHEARRRLIARHAGTTFIAAHAAFDGEDLDATARLLDIYPNVVLDIASRISELGRQPYSAREFMIRYQDRILFATDGPWPEARYQLYWRFLETRDEYFPYSEKAIPPQGIWRIYGVDLPDVVLRKIYHANAARLIPGVAERLHRWQAANPAANPLTP